MTSITLSLREAKRRGNPELRMIALDCCASLAMTVNFARHQIAGIVKMVQEHAPQFQEAWDEQFR